MIIPGQLLLALQVIETSEAFILRLPHTQQKPWNVLKLVFMVVTEMQGYVHAPHGAGDKPLAQVARNPSRNVGG